MEENNTNIQTLEMEAPELTLEETPVLNVEEVIKEVNTEIKDEKPIIEEAKFTPEEKKAIEDFSQKIDVTNTNLVLQYGSGAQKHIATFSETALENVRNKDMGSVGNMLSDLVAELKGFSATEEKGFLGFFKKSRRSIEKLKANYGKVETNVDNIVEMLETHQVTLLKDIALYNKMYEMNTAYYKELDMYIAAGKLKLEELNNVVIPQMKEKARQSNATEDAQAANDMVSMVDRFEKRIHDLELTRMISIQMGPQIRLLQNNDSLLVEKIHSSIVNTIPLWKSQMILALGLEHSRQAMQAQREVTDMTNKLLKENAEMLKQGTIEVTKESERGIVDIETLAETNKKLIETIDEVIKLQAEGKTKRKAAEVELVRIEDELKTKLLEVGTKAN